MTAMRSRLGLVCLLVLAVGCRRWSGESPASQTASTVSPTNLSGRWCDAQDVVESCHARGRKVLTIKQRGETVNAEVCDADAPNACVVGEPGALQNGEVALRVRYGADKSKLGTITLKRNSDGTLAFELVDDAATERYRRRFRRSSE